MSGRAAAIAAVTIALRNAGLLNNAGYIDGDEEWAAEVAVDAAERAWPHEPPKRDPASSTHLTTDRAWTAARRAPATGQAFGFSRPGTPDHYLGGATVAEGYRDEKWQDATS